MAQPKDSTQQPQQQQDQQPAKAFHCPKELDILPPRPVLFPCLPESLDCCGTTKPRSRPPPQKRGGERLFSFDRTKLKDSGSSSPGTPVTIPLSPSDLSSGSGDKDNDDASNIPDMSRLDTPSEAGSYHSTRSHGRPWWEHNHHHKDATKNPRAQHHHHQHHQKLVSLTDVIAEVLRVIIFIMSTKRALLREEEARERDFRADKIPEPVGSEDGTKKPEGEPHD